MFAFIKVASPSEGFCARMVLQYDIENLEKEAPIRAPIQSCKMARTRKTIQITNEYNRPVNPRFLEFILAYTLRGLVEASSGLNDAFLYFLD